MGITKSTHFYKDRPVFGFDIGHDSIKIMQTERRGKKPRIIGFGTASFDASAIDDGVIIKPTVIAEAAGDLFKHHLIGKVTTNRAIIAIPSYRTYTRLINLPDMPARQLNEAVSIEAEQYIPLPLEELYLDYEIVGKKNNNLDIFAVAVPRKIVDSQLTLMEILGLETIGVETTIDAAGKLFLQDRQSDVPAVLIDFGSVSADVAVFDQHTLVSGTVSGGGKIFTEKIKQRLGVTMAEAHTIKTKYGLGPSRKQADILEAVSPVLQQVAQEIRRMIRYYEDRYDNKRKVTQVLTLGGGANMPGLADFLTNTLRLAARPCDPWEYCDRAGFQAPNKADKPMYATVMGLSLVSPEELFR